MTDTLSACYKNPLASSSKHWCWHTSICMMTVRDRYEAQRKQWNGVAYNWQICQSLSVINTFKIRNWQFVICFCLICFGESGASVTKQMNMICGVTVCYILRFYGWDGRIWNIRWHTFIFILSERRRSYFVSCSEISSVKIVSSVKGQPLFKDYVGKNADGVHHGLSFLK